MSADKTAISQILSPNVNHLRLRNIRHREPTFAHLSKVVDLFAVQKERLIPIADDLACSRCDHENRSSRPFDQAAAVVNLRITDHLARTDTGSECSAKNSIRPCRYERGFPPQRQLTGSVFGQHPRHRDAGGRIGQAIDQ